MKQLTDTLVIIASSIVGSIFGIMLVVGVASLVKPATERPVAASIEAPAKPSIFDKDGNLKPLADIMPKFQVKTNDDGTFIVSFMSYERTDWCDVSSAPLPTYEAALRTIESTKANVALQYEISKAILRALAPKK